MRKQKGQINKVFLHPWQEFQIVKTVIAQTPDQLKLPFHLWTKKAVAELIKQMFGASPASRTLDRYMEQWGFNPRMVGSKGLEKNSKKIAQWLKNEFPKISRRARNERAEIYWGGKQMIFSPKAPAQKLYRRLKKPTGFERGKRFSCSLLFAVTNRKKLSFMTFRTRFCSRVFLNFLRHLVRQAQCLVFLIVDPHRVHCSKEVQRWVSRNSQNICLFFHPPR